MKGVLPITIEEMLVPETGAAGQSVEINVYAEAPNGCFRDLKVTLLRLNSQHYLFRATGYYDSNDACPAVVSSIDTLIVFEPPSAGEFYFQANEDPLPILRDTVTVM